MTNQERENLNAFLFTCHQMQNTGFGKLFTIAPTRTYRIQGDSPHSAKLMRKIDPDSLHAFLIPFRKIILNNDPANLFRVINILSKNSSRRDQIRLREIKRRLKKAESELGYGVSLLTLENDQWVPVSGRATFENYINSILFHNDIGKIRDGSYAGEMDTFATGAMFQYIIFTYKQALRIAGSIRLRYRE